MALRNLTQPLSWKCLEAKFHAASEEVKEINHRSPLHLVTFYAHFIMLPQRPEEEDMGEGPELSALNKEPCHIFYLGSPAA